MPRTRRLPEEHARFGIERYDRGRGPTRVSDQFSIDHQRRRASAPDQFRIAVEQLEEIHLPLDRAGLECRTSQVAERAQEKDATTINERRGPRRVIVVELAECRISNGPQQRTVAG